MKLRFKTALRLLFFFLLFSFFFSVCVLRKQRNNAPAENTVSFAFQSKNQTPFLGESPSRVCTHVDFQDKTRVRSSIRSRSDLSYLHFTTASRMVHRVPIRTYVRTCINCIFRFIDFLRRG